ncbi:MAG TPA: AAA family ATPase [Arachidicoccus sp.]|nr:AAA family ATPase [Arachidicoccus sp.]
MITGGPGTGKTTVIKSLQKTFGYAIQMEAGRSIIQQQMLQKGTLLPWLDPSGFADAMFRISHQQYLENQLHSETVIFDRGIPDIIGFLHLYNLPVPKAYLDAATDLRYQSKVFIAPPWKEIYTKDAERQQSWQEAKATYLVMLNVYTKLGYQLIHLPLDSPLNRTLFIHQHIVANTAASF